TEKYLAHIEAIDKHGPAINSVIEVNPDVLEIAKGLDKERKQKHLRGPLHGIPILIKDNIDTSDRMMTTAGSLALVGSRPPKDAMVAQKLREADAAGKQKILMCWTAIPAARAPARARVCPRICAPSLSERKPTVRSCVRR